MNGYDLRTHVLTDRAAQAQRPARRRTKAVARSSDGRYLLLAGRADSRLVIHDVPGGQYRQLERDKAYDDGHRTAFLDEHRFFVEADGLVDFYSARTGARTGFLQMQFGYRQGQNVLLGFEQDRLSGRFAVIYQHVEAGTEPREYWVAMFSREGRLLDSFRSGIPYAGGSAERFCPALRLTGYQLHVAAPELDGGYLLTFFAHITEGPEAGSGK